jgi:putative flippase GtrA
MRILLSESKKQFLRFCITGGLGTVTNLVVFFLCADVAGLPEIPVSIGCFLIAATQNYIIDHRWSFKEVTAGESLSFKKWALFLGSAAAGLAVNITAMEITLALFPNIPYKTIAQAVGSASGMIINFCASKLIVFRKKR